MRGCKLMYGNEEACREVGWGTGIGICYGMKPGENLREILASARRGGTLRANKKGRHLCPSLATVTKEVVQLTGVRPGLQCW